MVETERRDQLHGGTDAKSGRWSSNYGSVDLKSR